jgi:hypothetical protein
VRARYCEYIDDNDDTLVIAIFKDIINATLVKRKLDDRRFYGREIKVDYAADLKEDINEVRERFRWRIERLAMPISG